MKREDEGEKKETAARNFKERKKSHKKKIEMKNIKKNETRDSKMKL